MVILCETVSLGIFPPSTVSATPWLACQHPGRYSSGQAYDGSHRNFPKEDIADPGKGAIFLVAAWEVRRGRKKSGPV